LFFCVWRAAVFARESFTHVHARRSGLGVRCKLDDEIAEPGEIVNFATLLPA